MEKIEVLSALVNTKDVPRFVCGVNMRAGVVPFTDIVVEPVELTD